MTAPTDSKSIIRQTWSLFGETAKAENRSELIERFEPEFKRFGNARGAGERRAVPIERTKCRSN
jgi:hypothetical protein